MTHFAPDDTPCQTDPVLFDGETYDAIAIARDQCKKCHAYAACLTWARGRRDLVGVVAGIPRGETAERWRRGRVTVGRPRRQP